ncbi:hypothetical protein [Clostridium sp. UBA7791]|uniref:hypothetical protein n=1 Tax=Clostridium sp. UBA7791 TaxID=1946379 RepID=UPI0032175A3D
MKFKDSSVSIKKVLILAIISIFIGSGLGIVGSISKYEFSKINEKNEVILAKINAQEKVLEESKVYLNTLASKETELKNKKEEILKVEKEAKAEKERLEKAEAERIAKAKAEQEKIDKVEDEKVASANTASQNSGNNGNSVANQEPIGVMVWRTATGKKYHKINNCGNTNPNNATYITRESAESQGLTPCSKCY